MNEEIESIKERIYTFLDKKYIEQESQYFILLSMVRELEEDILNSDDDEELEEPEEPEEEDAFEDFEDTGKIEKEINKPEEELKEEKESKPELPKSGHAIKMKEMLGKNQANRKPIKTTGQKDELDE